MAATATSPWGAKPGAWALDSEEHEEELLQQQKDETAAAKNRSTAPLADFPSLSAAASTKTKKKKAQTLSLAEFSTYDPAKARAAKLTHEDMMVLPTGPRERTAEELERNKLGGGFRSYGGGNSDSKWGRDRDSRGSDEPRRQGSFGRDSNKEFAPSKADEVDDWGAAKKTSVGGGFERGGRGERGDRGGFFDNSQSRADESDSWVSNKNFVPSEGRRYEKQRVGFESSGGADSDNWGKKKEEEGRKFGAFDSLRERRGGGFDSGNGGGVGADNWLKKKEEVGSGTVSVRPKLNLQPRKSPSGEDQQNEGVTKPKGSNPFGDARPREEVLKEQGKDWKEVDEKIESLKLKEKEGGLSDGPMFGKKSFGSGNGRASTNGDRFERSWRKTDVVDARPQSAEKSENGYAEEAESGNAEIQAEG